jgi:hypothetical protein
MPHTESTVRAREPALRHGPVWPYAVLLKVMMRGLTLARLSWSKP